MGTRTRDLVAHRIKYCLFEKGPNPLDAEGGEDTDTPTILEADESLAVEEKHNVDPCGALEKLLDVMHNAVVRHGRIVNGQPQAAWIHRRVLHPVITGLSFALEVVAISAGSLRPSEDGQMNGVYPSL